LTGAARHARRGLRTALRLRGARLAIAGRVATTRAASQARRRLHRDLH
jgi:hypothetical protein